MGPFVSRAGPWSGGDFEVGKQVLQVGYARSTHTIALLVRMTVQKHGDSLPCCIAAL